MRAINHALGGALIGLNIGSPVVATILAFGSHFILDAVPHHDLEGEEASYLATKKFMQQLILDIVACAVLIAVLIIGRPEHWVLAAVCGFLGASPDLMWVRRLHMAKATGKIAYAEPWWERFHARIQWATGPQYLWVEALWFVLTGYILWRIIV